MGIFATVPVARNLQVFVYNSLGREFFTYTVLFFIFAGLTILLYLFIFKLRIKKISQYLWLFACGSVYVYYTIKLKEHPEEAIHFLEYGLLSYFVFMALSRKIRDWTIYITSALLVLFVGTIDEFLQWMMPNRFWDFRDIGLNTLAGGIFLLGLWKGVKPKIICSPVKKISAKMLVGVITVNLLLLGLCLSNTPCSVNYYTERLNILSWLRNEESMTELAYKHRDSELGVFYSRLNLKELREVDLTKGKLYGETLSQDINSEMTDKELIEIYNPCANPFLYEFTVHLLRRDSNLKEITESSNTYERIKSSNIALKENLILERYFWNTLMYSGHVLPDELVSDLKKTASLWKEDYVSKTGRLVITSFNLRSIWMTILTILAAVWLSGMFWKRRLNN
ncbi:MAG: VanZ family protein [Thermodesulfovibrionia bacterium]|nr:VanZ family protein [Thermodesulfovibrionia bacterium]